MTEGTLCLCGHHAWSHATQPYKDGHLRLDGPCLERDGCGSFNGKGVFARWIDHGERPSHPIGAPCAICEGFQAWVEPSDEPLLPPLTPKYGSVQYSRTPEEYAIRRAEHAEKRMLDLHTTIDLERARGHQAMESNLTKIALDRRDALSKEVAHLKAAVNRAIEDLAHIDRLPVNIVRRRLEEALLRVTLKV